MLVKTRVFGSDCPVFYKRTDVIQTGKRFTVFKIKFGKQCSAIGRLDTRFLCQIVCRSVLVFRKILQPRLTESISRNATRNNQTEEDGQDVQKGNRTPFVTSTMALFHST